MTNTTVGWPQSLQAQGIVGRGELINNGLCTFETTTLLWESCWWAREAVHRHMRALAAAPHWGGSKACLCTCTVTHPKSSNCLANINCQACMVRMQVNINCPVLQTGRPLHNVSWCHSETKTKRSFSVLRTTSLSLHYAIFCVCYITVFPGTLHVCLS